MKYICTICGFIYDETKEKVKFKDLPDDWKCPLCGASKSDFELLEEEGIKEESKNEDLVLDEDLSSDELEKLTIGQLAALFSNLARGAEKQYLFSLEESFLKLAKYFTDNVSEEKDANTERIMQMLQDDLSKRYVLANNVNNEYNDRGAKRACLWSEKVTKIIKTLIIQYEKEGEAMFKDSSIWVCSICGYIYVGKTPLEKCPVCRVTGTKFTKIDGSN